MVRGNNVTQKNFRIFWSLLLLTSASIFFLLLFHTTKKFLAQKTGVRIAGKETAIAEIPFPAVTICSDSLIHKAIFDFANNSINYRDDK